MLQGKLLIRDFSDQTMAALCDIFPHEVIVLERDPAGGPVRAGGGGCFTSSHVGVSPLVSSLEVPEIVLCLHDGGAYI